MPIDSAHKRASVAGIHYISGPGLVNDSSLTEAWRRSVGYSYSFKGDSNVTAGHIQVLIDSDGDRQVSAMMTQALIATTDNRNVSAGHIQLVINSNGNRQVSAMMVQALIELETIPADPTGLTVARI